MIDEPVDEDGFEIAWWPRDHITCPHCGTADKEHTDYPRALRYDGDRVEYDCWKCSKTFEVVLHVTFEYASYALR